MKAINQLPAWAIWGLAFPLIVLNGSLLILIFNYFNKIISIFIAANLLAFILNYLVQFLGYYHVKKQRAVLWVIFLTVFILVILGITIAPIIVSQLNDLANRLPSWIDSGNQQLESLNEWAKVQQLPLDLSGIVAQLTNRLSSQLQSLTGQVLSVVLSTLGSVFDVVLTVVLTFYILLKGEELWEGILQWFPQPLGANIQQLLRQNFHNYFVGQASLASMVGVSMTLTFWILQVPFFLLFGIGVGFMALFPFGVAFSICTISLLIALKSFWLGIKVLVVTVILEQIIENGIAPRLLGEFIGLNPIWILLALLIGAKLAGILGLLIAVPVAGFIKNLAHLWRGDYSEPTKPEVDLILSKE